MGQHAAGSAEAPLLFSRTTNSLLPASLLFSRPPCSSQRREAHSEREWRPPSPARFGTSRPTRQRTPDEVDEPVGAELMSIETPKGLRAGQESCTTSTSGGQVPSSVGCGVGVSAAPTATGGLASLHTDYPNDESSTISDCRRRKARQSALCFVRRGTARPPATGDPQQNGGGGMASPAQSRDCAREADRHSARSGPSCPPSSQCTHRTTHIPARPDAPADLTATNLSPAIPLPTKRQPKFPIVGPESTSHSTPK